MNSCRFVYQCNDSGFCDHMVLGRMPCACFEQENGFIVWENHTEPVIINVFN